MSQEDSQHQEQTISDIYTHTFRLDRPDGKKWIEELKLQRFENRTPKRKYMVEFSCPEFTCVCPLSNFPDFAIISIRYMPKKWCVELKSLKLYFYQFRDRPIFHEDAVNVILEDLVKLLDPWEIEVVGDFSVRGNIKTVVRARYPEYQTLF